MIFKDITLESTAVFIIFLGSLVAALGVLYVALCKSINKIVEPQIQDVKKDVSDVKTEVKNNIADIKKDIADVKKDVKEVDMNATKNFLVKTLDDFEHGKHVSEAVRDRFWKQYDYYISKGENSSIKNRTNYLLSTGKIYREEKE